ncbi:hypothetical protein A2U01_0093961, partial [Trifolium medium]|nr:hypothetical protein [Trifolium medium]
MSSLSESVAIARQGLENLR